jgi:hypothetical protein
MYADDLAYVKVITTPQDKAELAEDIERLSRKYMDISLSLNAKKCKCLLFTAKETDYDLEISINGEKIEQIKQSRYLGIELDQKLNYKDHITKISTKCRQAIGALCRPSKSGRL